MIAELYMYVWSGYELPHLTWNFEYHGMHARDQMIMDASWEWRTDCDVRMTIGHQWIILTLNPETPLRGWPLHTCHEIRVNAREL